MNFNNTWRNYLQNPVKSQRQLLLKEAYKHTYLLAEGKKQDAKIKFPITNQFGVVDIIANQLRAQFGDRGVSKYIMFACKCMEKFYKTNTTQDDFGTYKLRAGIIATTFFEQVMGTVVGFHDAQQRLEEKDINKYTFESLWQTLEELPESKGERKRRLKDKDLAQRDSEVVYNEHGIIAVRPLTTQASCYYGENPRLTTWCISTKSKKNYFKQYTEEKGRAFVIVKFTGIPEGNSNHIVSLEFDHRGEMLMWWDAPNRSFEPEDLIDREVIFDHLAGIEERKYAQAIASFQSPPNRRTEEETYGLALEIYNNLLEASREKVVAVSPRDPMEVAEEKCRSIEVEYDQKYEHVNLYWEIVEQELVYDDDVPFGVIYGAEMSVVWDIDKPEYENSEGNPFLNRDRSYWTQFEMKIEDVLRRRGPPWSDMIDALHCYEEDGYVKLESRFSGGDFYHGDTASGFQDFAEQECNAINNRGIQLEELLDHLLRKEIEAGEAGELNQSAQLESSPLDENEFYKNLEMQILGEEKGRSRQRGIYKFYCMIAYALTTEGEKSRGLDDILADLRAIENVTIVTVAIRNQKVAEGRYIAGLSIKFIPSTPGSMNTPENVKARIVRDIKRLANVHSLFKLSTGLIRLE